jgi:bifunctional DNA-binding transcriptional regulator/antitoxin component of YhaV-PrlF toxin-antitoxin module
MGRLRERGLLVETTVDGELRVVVPVELREIGDWKLEVG